MTRVASADRAILRDLGQQVAEIAALPNAPNLRRISISSFADVERCAERLGGDVVFSWKPHPAHLIGKLGEPAIRSYTHHALTTTQREGCVLEMVLKDTHTCEHRPDRFDRWTQTCAPGDPVAFGLVAFLD